MPRGPLALTLFIVATMGLFAVTASAGAEVTGTAATGLAQESSAPVSSAPVEPTPAPAVATEPVDTPETKEAPADEGGATTTAMANEEEPVAPTPPITKTVTHSPSTSPAPPNGSQPHAAQATSGSLSSALPADPENATSAATDRVSELTGKVRQDSGGTVARAVDRAAETGSVQRLAPDPLRMARETVHRAALDLVTVDLEKLPLLGAPARVDPGPLAIDLGPPPTAVPGIRNMPTDSRPARQAISLSGTLGNQLAGPADVDLTLFEAPRASGLFAGLTSRASANPSGAYLAQAGEQSRNFTPLNGNGPTPLPDSPQVGVSGSAASSFAPIAALLALLALAVPAIRRRPWEMSAFSAPTPFVCVLERPG